MKRILPVLLLLLLARGAAAQEVLAPPGALLVADRENDFGGAVALAWQSSPSEETAEGFSGYRVYRAADPDGPWERLAEVPAGTFEFTDGDAPDDGAFYRVTAVFAGVESPPAASAASVKPEANWFNPAKYKSLLIVFIFTSLVLGWIWAAGNKVPGGAVVLFFGYALMFTLFLLPAGFGAAAFVPFLIPGIALLIPLLKRSGEIYIRPIPAIQAVEEAIGRATEMGKPILFVPGISTIEDVATLAALNILSPVAEKAAEYDSKLIVPNYDPIVFTVTQEVVKEAYMKAGRPDAYSDDNVFYLSARQFAYAAAVNGIMMREKPATNFFLGMFFAESLLLAETGNMTGAIQIAGTDAVTQLPFFIVACDYTLIGEELYAAGAYMGGDPKLTGSLKGQDWNKALGIAFLVLSAMVFLVYGAVSKPADWPEWMQNLPKTLFEVGR